MRRLFATLAVALFLVGTAHNAHAALFTYSGDTTGGPTFNRPFCGLGGGGALDCSLSDAGTAVRYDMLAFTVDLDADYTMVNVAGGLTDSVFVLYRNAFAPASPLVNVYAYNDDFDVIFGRARIMAPLVAGTPYFLVTTAFANDDFGTFTNEIRGDGNVIPGTVPEPTSLALLGSALAGLLLRRARASR